VNSREHLHIKFADAVGEEGKKKKKKKKEKKKMILLTPKEKKFRFAYAWPLGGRK